MKRLNTLTLGAARLAATAYAAGCAGEGPDALDVPYDYGSGSGAGSGETGSGAGPTTGGQSAEAFYKAEVHDELTSQCASCHGTAQEIGPVWLESDADSAYATLKANGLVDAPDCARLITHTKGSHSGVPFTTDFEPTVIEWLQKEATENGLACASGGGGETGGALAECEAALEGFAECMSFAYWEVSGAYDIPNQNTDSGPCSSCHPSGQGGAFLSQDSLATFNAHKDDLYFLIKIVRCGISGGEFQGLQPALRYDNKGTEPCNNPSGNCHPDYVLTPERSDGLQMFVEDTMNAAMNGTCAELDQQAEEQLANQ